MKTLEFGFDRMDEQYADDSEYDEATADALDTATRLFAEPTADEEALLQKMKEWAKRARGQRESKVKNWLHGSRASETRRENGPRSG